MSLKFTAPKKVGGGGGGKGGPAWRQSMEELFGAKPETEHLVFREPDDTGVRLKLAVVIDASGSMAYSPFVNTCCALEALKDLHGSDVAARVFGAQGVRDPRNTTIRTLGDVTGPSYFRPGSDRRGINTGTQPLSLATSIPELVSQGPTHLLIIGDGEFNGSGGRTGAQVFGDLMLGLHAEGKLANVFAITVYIPFLGDVRARIVDALRASLTHLTNVLSARYVPVDLVCGASHRDRNTLVRAIGALGTARGAPEGCVGMGDTYWPEDEPTARVVDALRRAPARVQEFVDLILHNVRSAPTILATPGSIYGRVHGFLRQMAAVALPDGKTVQEAYINVVSTLKGTASAADRVSLDAFMQSSRAGDKTKTQMLGLLSKTRMVITTPIDSVAISQDPTGEALRVALLEALRGGIEFAATAGTSAAAPGGGMPVPIRARYEEIKRLPGLPIKTWPDVVGVALSRFVSSLCGVVLPPKRVTLLAMLLLASAKIKIVPKVLTTMAATVVLDPARLKGLLGLSADGTTVVIDSFWYHGPNACLLSRFLGAYRAELGLAADAELAEIARYFRGIRDATRGWNATRATLAASFKVSRVGLPGLGGAPAAGALVLVDWNSADPEHARFPSIAVVSGLRLWGKNRLWRVVYLDEPRDAKSLAWAVKELGLPESAFRVPGEESYHVPAKKLTVLGVPSEETVDTLNRAFIVSKRARSPLDEGVTDADWALLGIAPMRDVMDTLVEKLVLADTTTGLQPCVLESAAVCEVLVARVPMVADILGLGVKPGQIALKRAQIDALLALGTVREAALGDGGGGGGAADPDATVSAAAPDATITVLTAIGRITLTAAEVDRVLATHRRFSAPPVGAKTQNVAECAVCLDAVSARRCAFIECGHFVCKGCHVAMLAPLRAALTAGAILPLNLARCPICRIGSLAGSLKAVSDLLAAGVADGALYRACEDCHDIFNCGDRACGDDDAKFPTKCEACLLRSDEALFFACPRCDRGWQHAGGCMLMRCCPRGYHECGNDEYEDCDHDGNGCGHVWDISDAERARGNAT